MYKFLSFLFFFSFAFGSFAQEYKFNVFTQEEGLPQPYVYDIAQAKNGFLFLATGDGLGMFGGTKFKKATVKDGLSENFCNSLFKDSKERLWIGHFEGGVSFLENNQFKKINTKNTTAAKIVAFAEDVKGLIYYANSAGDIYTIENNTIKLFTKEALEPINEIKIHNQKLYVASQAGLFYYDLNVKTPQLKTITETLSKNVVTIDFFRNNDLTIGIEGEGIEIYKNSNSDFKLVKTINSELNSLRKTIKDVIITNSEELLISLHGEGIKKFQFTTSYEISKASKIDTKNGLKNLFINKLFIDIENNLWLGSYGAGLFQMSSQRFELYNKGNVLPFDNIKSIAVSSANEIIVTNEKQLFVFNAGSDIPNFNNELLKADEETEIRTTYYEPEKKMLWVGTTKGLLIYDLLNGSVTLKKEIDLLKNKTVNRIVLNNKHEIIICTTEGLFILNQEYKLIKYYSTDTGLPHNNISGCFIDKDNQLWMFSPETPLYKILNDSIEMVREIDPINSYQFNNAVQDKQGNIWFGTDGGGIYKYDRNKKTTHFTTDNGLNSDFIYAISLTSNGDVIAGHKNGISIKYHQVGYFKPITRSNGLQASNINANSIDYDSHGNVWIGSTEGLLKYIPSEDRINTKAPILSLLQLKLNNKRLRIQDSVFELSYDKYELEIDFIGVSLSNPKEVKYKYKLEGFSNIWQTTDEQKIIFPKLEDGDYRLIIHAINGDGVETVKPITFTINISKPFWKSVWFYLLCASLLSGIWYLIYRARTESLLKIKAQLEKMVAIKTSELVVEKELVEKANELLEEKNHDITDSISYAQRIQSAILPSLEGMTKNLDTFVFYQARDIVSGDFYWYYETDQYYYIAAVDCTGHGVPGAFMSLLGGTYLDQIMIELLEPSPSEILKTLDAKILNSFHYQKNDGDLIRDGMDVAICQIRKNKQSIVVSNAGRPIYLVHHKELTEIKSNNVSIGGKTDGMKQYENTELVYEEGTCIYLFSDGYCDQFGGEKNKRYTTKRLKTLLPEIAQLSSHEQQEYIKKEHFNWKAETEQTDDVLFIGIKL